MLTYSAYLIPYFGLSQHLQLTLGGAFVILVFLALFGINNRILAPNNSHPLTKLVDKYYRKPSTVISKTTVDWLDSLDNAEADFVNRLIVFTYLNRPLEENYDSIPKNNGIDGYVLWFPSAPMLMNGYFDNHYEIDRAIQMGLLSHLLKTIPNGQSYSFPPSSTLKLFKPQKAVMINFVQNTTIEVFCLTGRAMDILEAHWVTGHPTNTTSIRILKDQLANRATISLCDYEVRDISGRRVTQLSNCHPV